SQHVASRVANHFGGAHVPAIDAAVAIEAEDGSGPGPREPAPGYRPDVPTLEKHPAGQHPRRVGVLEPVDHAVLARVGDEGGEDTRGGEVARAPRVAVLPLVEIDGGALDLVPAEVVGRALDYRRREDVVLPVPEHGPERIRRAPEPDVLAGVVHLHRMQVSP